MKTEISKRIDEKYNIWGLIPHPESPILKDEEGNDYRYKVWTIVGVAENAKEAKEKQYKFRSVGV